MKGGGDILTEETCLVRNFIQISEVQLLVSLRNSEVEIFFFNGKDTERKKYVFRYSVQLISEKEGTRQKGEVRSPMYLFLSGRKENLVVEDKVGRNLHTLHSSL